MAMEKEFFKREPGGGTISIYFGGEIMVLNPRGEEALFCKFKISTQVSFSMNIVFSPSLPECPI